MTWLAIVLVLLMAAGHVSNLLSLKSSEREVFRWFLDGEGRGQILRYPMHGTDLLQFTMLARWDFECEKYKMVSDEEFRTNPYGTAQVAPAVPVCPFVTCVEFAEVMAPLAGAGGKAYLLNLFGKSWVIHFDPDWVS